MRFIAFLLLSALAMTARSETITVTVQPKVLYTNGGLTSMAYEDVSGAFTAGDAVWSVDDGQGNSIHAINPHPSTRAWPYNMKQNGTPWWTDTDSRGCGVPNGCVTSPDTGFGIQGSLHCPEGPVFSNGTPFPVGFTLTQTNRPEQVNTLWSCIALVDVIPPPCLDCWRANPIYPATGQKMEIMQPYRHASGRVAFTQTYRSTNGNFASDLTARVMENVSPVYALPCCYDGHFTFYGQVWYVGYSLQSPAPTTNVVVTSQGTSISFPPAKPDINERLLKRTNAGQTEWVLWRDDNTIEVFNQAGALSGKASSDGTSRLTYTYSDASTPINIAPHPGLLIAIVDQFGVTLGLTYDAAGKLSTLIDPDQKVYQYGYDTLGRFTSVLFPDGKTRRYFYDEPQNINNGTACGQPPISLVTGQEDEKGARWGEYKYDCSGRAVGSAHIGGVDNYAFSYTGSPNSITTETDPLGAGRTYRFTAVQTTSHVSQITQPTGVAGGTATKTFTFDANGNIASTTDFAGNVTCNVSDLVRNLEVTRVEGLASASCSSYTPANAALPAGSRKISRQWHPDWRLESARAEPGKITTKVYNGQPDPFNGGAAASCAPSTAPLPDGKVIAVLCKQVEQATTDADGHLGFGATLQAGVANRVQQWTYNQYGQVLTAKSPRTDVNDTTNYAYYASTTANYSAGDLSSITNSALQTTQFPIYNKHGQVMRSIDPNGIVTDYTYDLRMRLKTATVGGLPTTYTYEDTGELSQVTLPDTTSINYVHDPAHRLTKVTDQAGNSITYTLDNAGNRKVDDIKDPSGTLARSVTRIFDVLGRVQQLTGASN